MATPSCLKVFPARGATICLGALLIAAFLCVPPGLPQQNPPPKKLSAPAKTLPLDPLAAEEKAAAERIAIEDGRVKELLGAARARLISVTLLALKGPKLEESPRLVRYAEVILLRSEGDWGVRAVVNLEKKTVEQVTRLEADRVPLNSDDLKDAFQLALREEELRKALGPAAESYQVQATRGNSVTGLRVRGRNASDLCFKHRCIQLFFRKGTAFLTQPSVLVDLTAKKVYLERSKP